MTDFEWLRPEWLILLVAIPLLAIGAFFALQKRNQLWKNSVSQRLQNQLVDQTPQWTHWSSLGLGFLGLLLLSLALTKPIKGYTEEESVSEGHNILFIVDTSRSMRTTDVTPSRLEKARAIAFECIPKLSSDRIGVIAFANEPFVMSPLTVDHNIVNETFKQLRHESLPEGGSNLAAAIGKGLKIINKTGPKGSAIIVMSDGEDHDSELDEVTRNAVRLGVPIITIGIGSLEGAYIPDPNQKDNTFRDHRGKPVLSRLKIDSLKRLALESSGKYIHGQNVQATEKEIRSLLKSLDRNELDVKDRRRPNEKFQWFLFPAILCFIASLLVRANWKGIRTAAIAPVVSLFILAPSDASAEESAATQAQAAYEKEDFEKAINYYDREIDRLTNPAERKVELWEETKDGFAGRLRKDRLPELHFALGSALYKNGDYVAAVENFSESLLSSDKKTQIASHYNLGNAMAKIGEQKLDEAKLGDKLGKAPLPVSVINAWQDAIEQYDQTLAADPNHTQAKSNRDAIEQALEKLTPPEQKDQQQQKDQNKGDKEEDKEKEEEKDKQDSQEKDQRDEKQDSGDKGEEDPEKQKSEGDKGDEENPEEQEEGKGEEPTPDAADQEGNKENETPKGDQKEGAPSSETESSPTEESNENTQQQSSTKEIFLNPQELALRDLKEGADLIKPPRKKSRKRSNPKKNW